MTFEAPSQGPSNEEILEFLRTYRRQKRICDEENGVLRNILKRAKAAGIPTKETRQVAQLSKQYDSDEALAVLSSLIRIAAISGLVDAEKLPLFEQLDTRVTDKAQDEEALAQAEHSGYRAGMDGAPSDDNPYPIGSELSQTWAKWRARGQSAAAKINGENEEQVTASKEQPAARGRGRPKGSKAAAPSGSAKPAKQTKTTQPRRGGGVVLELPSLSTHSAA